MNSMSKPFIKTFNDRPQKAWAGLLMNVFFLILTFLSSCAHASCFCPEGGGIQSVYALNDKIYLGKLLSVEPPSDAFPWGRAEFQVVESFKGVLSNAEYVNKGNPYKCGFHTQAIKISEELLIMSSTEGDIPVCTNFDSKTYEQFIGEFRELQKQLNKTLN